MASREPQLLSQEVWAFVRALFLEEPLGESAGCMTRAPKLLLLDTR